MCGGTWVLVFHEKKPNTKRPQQILFQPNTEARTARPPPPSRRAEWAVQPACGGAAGRAGHSTGSEGWRAAAVGVAFPKLCAQVHVYDPA